MRAREAQLNKQRFNIKEMNRNVEDLEMMIRDFEGMANDLERQIQAEEDRTGVRDPSHFAYSTFARSAAQRREKLETSINELKERLAGAIAIRDEALTELDDADAAASGGRRAADTALNMSDAYAR